MTKILILKLSTINPTLNELKNHLVEYFSSDGKAETTIERRAKVKSYLKILLTDDRAFKRDELKSIISEKETWKAAFDRLNPSYNSIKANLNGLMDKTIPIFSTCDILSLYRLGRGLISYAEYQSSEVTSVSNQ